MRGAIILFALLVAQIAALAQGVGDATGYLFKEIPEGTSIEESSQAILEKVVIPKASKYWVVKGEFDLRVEVPTSFTLLPALPMQFTLEEKVPKPGRQILNYMGSKREDLFFVVTEEGISGDIRIFTDYYRITDIGNELKVIFKVDHKHAGNYCTTTYTGTENGSGNDDYGDHEHGVEDIDTDGAFSDQFFDQANARTSSENIECNLRLLVLYTPAAKLNVTNIRTNIFASVERMNRSLNNSDITDDVEVVYIGETNYTEVGHDGVSLSPDLENFQDDSDGDMDEVHTLRDRYRADMCVLMYEEVSTTGLLGQAFAIDAQEDEAFCIVDVVGDVGLPVFEHELGHLLGGIHDNTSTPSNFPFPEARGFVNSIVNNEFKTIMSVISSIDYIEHYSNPDVDILNGSGIPVATGVANQREAALVLGSTTVPDAIQFRLIPFNVSITAETSGSLDLRDATAENQISTSGSVVLNTGSQVSYRAGKEILLNNAFHAKSGATFEAQIQTVDNCSSSLKLALADQESTTESSTLVSIEENVAQEKFNVYPNPFANEFNVNFYLAEDQNVDIILYDLAGKEVYRAMKDRDMKAGEHLLSISTFDLQAGMYILKLYTPEKQYTQKVSKMAADR